MATQNIPITHIYKEVNKGKYLSVKHFELAEVTEGKPQLSELINISKNRNCAMSMPDYWLKIRQGKKWSGWLTGLFKTSSKNIFRGDLDKKKHLLLFKFSDNEETLTVYYFENYFIRDLNSVLHLLNNY